MSAADKATLAAAALLGSTTPIAVGSSAAGAGSAGTAARSDHAHALGWSGPWVCTYATPAANQYFGAPGAAGNSALSAGCFYAVEACTLSFDTIATGSNGAASVITVTVYESSNWGGTWSATACAKTLNGTGGATPLTDSTSITLALTAGRLYCLRVTTKTNTVTDLTCILSANGRVSR